MDQESNKALCATSKSLPKLLVGDLSSSGAGSELQANAMVSFRQTSLPISSPTKLVKKTPPLLRLNSDPKILPSTEESRQLEVLLLQDHESDNGISKLRSQLESGSVKCGQFLDPNHNNEPQQISSKKRSEQVKMLVKQKSLGRTLSTSVLRIKKKRSFWSNEKFKQ